MTWFDEEYGKRAENSQCSIYLILLWFILVCTQEMRTHHLWTYAAIHSLSMDQICSSWCGWHTSVKIEPTHYERQVTLSVKQSRYSYLIVVFRQDNNHENDVCEGENDSFLPANSKIFKQVVLNQHLITECTWGDVQAALHNLWVTLVLCHGSTQ